eukprot:snap_masked-scaffold_12-processed-gene-11.65-mRNA-1 protein AED:1.00 eAED:1.00 QI:0/-1/0/0/-1/1/1/0/91
MKHLTVSLFFVRYVEEAASKFKEKYKLLLQQEVWTLNQPISYYDKQTLGYKQTTPEILKNLIANGKTILRELAAMTTEGIKQMHGCSLSLD